MVFFSLQAQKMLCSENGYPYCIIYQPSNIVLKQNLPLAFVTILSIGFPVACVTSSNSHGNWVHYLCLRCNATFQTKPCSAASTFLLERTEFALYCCNGWRLEKNSCSIERLERHRIKLLLVLGVCI